MNKIRLQRMRSNLTAGCQQARMGLNDLWTGYVAVGGNAMPAQVDRFLSGEDPLDGRQYDLLAQALNDRFIGLGMDSPVPYFHETG